MVLMLLMDIQHQNQPLYSTKKNLESRTSLFRYQRFMLYRMFSKKCFKIFLTFRIQKPTFLISMSLHYFSPNESLKFKNLNLNLKNDARK